MAAKKSPNTKTIRRVVGGKKDEKVGSQLSGSGISVYQGYFYNTEYKSELNTEWNGGGLETYERMAKSDPVVGGGLDLINLGIKQAEWYVEAGSDSPEDVKIKDFVTSALFEKMDMPWTEVIENVTTYLPMGFFTQEKVFKMVGNETLLSKLSYMSQKSIMKFQQEDGSEGLMQYLDGDEAKEKGQQVSVPRHKFVLFTNMKRGANLRGQSILRRAYKPYFFKENFEKIDAIGFEREAVGVPVFTQPQNVKLEDVAKAEELGESLSTHEKSFMVIPFGWEFDIKYPTGTRRDATDPINRYNRDILLTMLAQWLLLGNTGSSGSHSLSDDHSGAFYKSLQAFADDVCGVYNNDVIKDLVDFNFPFATKYPKLRATGIEKIDPQIFATALSSMVSSGLLKPDDETEEFLRKIFRLPKMPDEYKGLRKEQMDMDIEQKKINVDNAKNGVVPANPAFGGNKDKGKDKEKDKKKLSERSRAVKLSELNRELTLAEEKVDFDSLRARMDYLEQSIISKMYSVMNDEIMQLLDKARTAIQNRDAKLADSLMGKLKDEVRNFVLGSFREAYEAGKLSAANELNVGAPRTPNDAINIMTSRSNMIADTLIDDIVNSVRLQVLGAIEQGTSPTEAIAKIESGFSSTLQNKISLTASAISTGGINTGRDLVYQENSDDIYALQRSEILDNRICNYCLSLDGRIILKTDPMAKIGQFHFLCRGIWVAIRKDEQELPDITGIPDELRRNVGNLNDFKQI